MIEFIPTGKEHSYLLFDPDLDMDDDPTTYDPSKQEEIPTIIRGGPLSLIGNNPIEIEILPELHSQDRFNGEYMQYTNLTIN